MKTRIEWADRTANPFTGCTPASEGCDNCYARRFALRLAKNPKIPEATRKKYEGFKPGQFHPERLEEIVKAPAGSTVFIGSMCDLFHEAVNVRGPEIRDVFRAVASSEATCLMLTKRPKRMAKAIAWHYGDESDILENEAPIKNLWLGVSVESQKWTERIAALLTIPAAGRFVSVEPMLGPIDLTEIHNKHPKLDWVIAGGEAGPGSRTCLQEWVRSLQRQCAEHGTPFLFKGWGDTVHRDQMSEDLFVQVDAAVNLGSAEGPYFRVGKKAAGRLLDEREWMEFPWTR